MILFVSDLHFGESDYAQERAKENDLVACLRAHESDVEQLYLVGDVFNTYIEYRHLVPKGFIRFQGLLAAWSDRGIPITYLVGNHDPWHGDYFERELGVRLVYDAVVEPLCGHTVYIAHGDGIHDEEHLYRQLRPWLRNPALGWLYRHLLPGDSGLRLARWVGHRVGRDVLDPRKANALRRHARRVLTASPADAAVMGHSHQPERCAWPEGTYLNTGAWSGHRTFGRLNPTGLNLLRWNGDRAVKVDAKG